MRDPDNMLLFFMFGLVALLIASYVALFLLIPSYTIYS